MFSSVLSNLVLFDDTRYNLEIVRAVGARAQSVSRCGETWEEPDEQDMYQEEGENGYCAQQCGITKSFLLKGFEQLE
jgi:hypothetical protein